MKYSVIVPTYNRATALTHSLRALAGQDVPAEDFEVIVVDDGSRDNTEEVVRAFMKDNSAKNFRYLRVPHGGPAKARNAGVKIARGAIVFFTDDDCLTPPYWIRKIADVYLRYPDAVGVGGWHMGPTAMSKQPTLERYELAYGLDFARWGDTFLRKEICSADPANKVGTTSNMSYRREAFEAFGGFDESIPFQGLEDWDLKLRMCAAGKLLVYVPIFVIHRRGGGLWAFCRRAFLSGRGSRYLQSRHGDRYVRLPGLDASARYIRWYMRNGGLPFVFFYALQTFCRDLGWYYGMRNYATS